MTSAVGAGVPGLDTLDPVTIMELNITRLNFELLAAGFSYALILRFATLLTTRKLKGTDTLAAITLVLWIIYITINAVDLWNRTVYGAPAGNWAWVLDFGTICYSSVLCCIFYISIMRVLALVSPHLKDGWRKALERIGLVAIGIIFILRGARTVLGFILTGPGNLNANMSTNSNYLQVATILPVFVFKVVFDVISMVKLYLSRVKYIEAAGKEAFRAITNALAVEFVLLCLATWVAFQETFKYPKWKFAFMDWVLFSWCLASWIEQRRQFRAIFGAALTSTSGGKSTGAPSGSENVIQTTNTSKSYNSQSGSTVVAYPASASQNASQNGYRPNQSSNSMNNISAQSFYTSSNNVSNNSNGPMLSPINSNFNVVTTDRVHNFSSRYPSSVTQYQTDPRCQ